VTATGFDPSQRRDWHGRWGTGGSPAAGQAKEYIAGLAGHVQLRELNDYDTAAYERDHLDPMTEGRTAAQQAAVTAYTDHSFEINARLRGDEVQRPRFKDSDLDAQADAISGAMRPLPDDLILLREIKGKDALSGFGPGDVIADNAFASTTLRPGRFAGGRDDTTVLHILAPKGTPVVWAGRAEDELILDRGQAMVIMGARVTPGGRDRFVTHLNVLVLPKGITP
jgi:hypothetical protein